MTDQPEQREDTTVGSWVSTPPDATQPLPRRKPRDPGDQYAGEQHPTASYSAERPASTSATADPASSSPYWWNEPHPGQYRQMQGSSHPTPPDGFAPGTAYGQGYAAYGSQPSDPAGGGYGSSGYGGTNYDGAYARTGFDEPGYGAGVVPGRGSAIAALVVGVLALLLVLFPLLPLLLGIIACVLAVIAMRRMALTPSRGRKAGRGMAIAGLVTGIIATLLGTVIGVVYVLSLRVLAPYVDDVAQCTQIIDTQSREECVMDVLDEISRDYGMTDVSLTDTELRSGDLL